jgi:hypothetical protein
MPGSTDEKSGSSDDKSESTNNKLGVLVSSLRAPQITVEQSGKNIISMATLLLRFEIQATTYL